MWEKGFSIGRVILAYAIMIGVVAFALVPATTTHAAAGINQQVNFQGRLFNAAGATVPDGYYNIQFKIYQDGDGLSVGNATGSPAGTLKWTESWLNQAGKGVMVKNGFISVQLGSITAFGASVDWNQDTLWLSMNIGSTNASCTPFTSCTPDGEMTPMKRLSATPYALNAARLGGLTSAGFIQNSTTPQTANIAIQSAAAGSVGANILGAASQTANLLQFQDNSGNINAAFNSTGNQLTLGRIAASGTVTQGKIVMSDGTTSNLSTTLQSATLTAGNQTIIIPNTAGAGGTLCLQNSTDCGFALISGSTAYIQNQNTSAQSGANFWIAGTGKAVSGFQGLSLDALSAGSLTIGNGTATSINIGKTTSNILTTISGTALFKPTTGNDSATAFQIQNAAGTSTLFTVDTTGSGTITAPGQTILGSTANQTQLIIKANASQSATTPLIKLQTSTGTELASISADGNNNLQFGKTSLTTLSSGTDNIALGTNALHDVTTTSRNIAIGTNAGRFMNASDNTAVGYSALNFSTGGTKNVALGANSLITNGTGSQNTAVGYNALYNNTNGGNNTALGNNAGYRDYGTGAGNGRFLTIATLQNATAIGSFAQVQTDNAIVLGSVDLGTKVGIGITTPTNTLTVAPVSLNSNSITATQSGNTVTSSAAIFSTANIGEIFAWDDGSTNTITGYTSTTVVTVLNSATRGTAAYFRTHKPGFNVTSTGDTYQRTTSATAFQVQNAVGTSTFTVDTTGNGTVTSLGQTALGGAADQVQLVVKGNAGQTTDLMQLRDSSANVNAAFSAAGNQLTLGRIAGSGTVTQGKIVLSDGTTSTFGTTLQSAALTTGSQTITIPNTAGVGGTLCLQGSSACNFAATTGGSGYIQNQNASAQATSNFWISGTGIAATLQAATIDTPSGTTTLNIGTTNATTGINLNQSAVLAASKSLTITGSGTRPGAPAEGMLYFDTTTKQLQVYSNGKWQADSKTAAFIVAASDSTQSDKDGAQYIADGENSTGTGTGTIDGDQTEINLALNAAAAAKNGTVYLAPGTYTIDQPIQIPNNITLAGSGESTIIQLGNFGATSVNVPIITNVDTSTGTGVTVRDLQLDGRKDRNSSGFQAGIYFEHMGASGRVGGKILNIHVRRMVSSGAEIYNSGGISITNSTFESNSGGIYLSAVSNTSVVGNTMWGNFYHGIDVESASQDNAFSANAIHDNNGDGILVVSSTKNSFSNNTIQYNGSVGVELLSANDNSISSNTIHDNANNGIVLTTSNNNAISSNRIQSSGGSTKNDSIWLATSDNNTITSNQIGDNAYSVSNYAINISNSGSDKNYLADNTFSSTAGNSLINDAGTNTIWSNQSSAENGSNLVIRDGSSTSAFDIQNASGASLLTMDTVNSTLNLASAVNVNGIAAPGAPGISLTNGGSLAYNTAYRYRLAAVNANGRSNAVASSPVSVTTAASGTIRTVTVNWTVVPGATAYYLYRSTDGGTTWYRNTVPGGGGVNTTTDTGASYTWSGTNYASDIYNNTSAIVNINNNGQIAFNSGNATINTSAVSQDLMISNYAAAKGIVLQGDYLTFMDTTGYATNFTITNTGATTLRNRSDSTAAFQIQNALNTSTAFMVDTSNSRVRIGSGTAPAYPLDVTGDVNTSTQYRIGGNVTLTNSALTFTGAATATVQSAASQALNLNGINNLTVQTNSITRATFDTANTLYLGNGVTAAAPSAFKISGTGSTTTAVAGGALTIQGGNATVGSANGGNVTITGGTGLGTGAAGLVVMSTPTFSTTANDANCYTSGALVAASCTITAASVNNSSAIIAGFNVIGQTATLPDPTIATAGRVVYITAANGSSDFTLSVNGGGQANQIAMRQNTTATMIWNGADWTAAGASSSTTLQSAYDNTLQSAGGAELIVSKTSTTNGLTIRDSTTAPVNGTLLTVQTSSAAGLFSVNSNVTEYASDAGAEVAGGTPTTFPASTWSSLTGTTASRYITAGDYIATGQGSVSAVTTAVANTGVKDQLTSALSANSTYNVSFTTRLTSGTFTDMNVYYSIDGTAASSVCTTAATSITSIWTKVNCTFTTPASGITSSNAILIRQTAGAIRTFYVDNLSVTIAADYNFATDGDVGDSANFATNWPTAGLGTVTTSRITSDGNDASDSAQAAVTAGAVNAGIRNKLSSNPLTGTLYRVTVYGKLISGAAFTDFKVRYSYNGNTTTTLSNYVDCVDYNTQTLTTTGWTKVTCYIKTDANAATNPHVYFAETTSAVRTFAVDTFSMTLATITTPNVQVGGGINGGPTTLFTLDKGASAPIASNNDALLGSMYYDTTLGKLQCYEADGWGACGSSPDNIVTISPEYTNAVLHGTGVGTMTSDLCSDGLNLNDGSSSQPTICGTNETYNFYKWTSPQSSAQTYSIFVTYQLPTTFKSFASGQTSLMGRTDSASSTVQYQVYRNTSTGLTACGSTVSVSTGVQASWKTQPASGASDPSTCGFAPSDSIVFKIDVIASSNANAYVGNLNFTFSNR